MGGSIPEEQKKLTTLGQKTAKPGASAPRLMLAFA
jgi:hypothetical protein